MIKPRECAACHVLARQAEAQLRGTLTADVNDPVKAQVSVAIGAATLHTKAAARDKHLRSADLFDLDYYPQLSFISQSINFILAAAPA